VDAAGGRALDGVQLMQLASSRDGVLLARLSVESGSGRDVGLCVTFDRGNLDIRIDAPDSATARWLEQRAAEIREAVEKSGLQLGSLDIARDGARDQAGQQAGHESEPAPLKASRTACSRAGGWTL
jgi:hypothetical protein